MPNCSSCQAPVVWAATTNGKRMPLDVQPRHEGGNVDLIRGGAPGGGLLAKVLTKEELAAHRGLLYTSHYATCPEAAAHRKPKGGPDAG